MLEPYPYSLLKPFVKRKSTLMAETQIMQITWKNNENNFWCQKGERCFYLARGYHKKARNWKKTRAQICNQLACFLRGLNLHLGETVLPVKKLAFFPFLLLLFFFLTRRRRMGWCHLRGS